MRLGKMSSEKNFFNIYMYAKLTSFLKNTVDNYATYTF